MLILTIPAFWAFILLAAYGSPWAIAAAALMIFFAAIG
jgi:hypothetical protein